MGHAAPQGFKITRRRLLAGAGALAGATLVPLPASAGWAAEAEALVGTIPRLRWDWTVEHMALARINTDRLGALRLLKAAFAVDLDPRATWRRKRALRLYDLFAAAATPAERRDLAGLVLASPWSDAALRARAALWADGRRLRRSPLWRTTGPDGQPLGILIAPA